MISCTHLHFSRWSSELLLKLSPLRSNMGPSFKSFSELRDHNFQRRRDWSSIDTGGVNNWGIIPPPWPLPSPIQDYVLHNLLRRSHQTKTLPSWFNLLKSEHTALGRVAKCISKPKLLAEVTSTRQQLTSSPQTCTAAVNSQKCLTMANHNSMWIKLDFPNSFIVQPLSLYAISCYRKTLQLYRWCYINLINFKACISTLEFLCAVSLQTFWMY